MNIKALILTAVLILGVAAPAANAVGTLGLGGNQAAVAAPASRGFVPYDPLRGRHRSILQLGRQRTVPTQALVDSGRLDPAAASAPHDPWIYGPSAALLAQLAWAFAQALR